MSHYTRLFGGPFPSHDETDLVELSQQMKDIPENRRGRPRLGDLAPSGFVYLGQFLDHDLTCDETRLEHAATAAPEQTPNRHAARLNLESVYGGGPAKSPDLYDSSEAGAETFLIGRTGSVPEQNIPSTEDDFFRRNGTRLLADNRNDQHLIIAQLHIVFLQFHNQLIARLRRGDFAEQFFSNETLFRTAQRLTVWHCQWIIRNEFLRWFVLPEILEEIEKHGSRFFKPRPNDGSVALPIEFTQAAFRFGHSMVQRQYDINRWTGLVRLGDLVRKTSPGKPSRAISADQVVDWDRFTKNWGGNANFAENIDTLISEDMFNLPAQSMPIPYRTEPPPLPEMTLLRGSRIGLPSGQEACEAAGVTPLRPEQIGFDDYANNFLHAYGLDERTPLWYYILREAEVLGVRKFRGGECLGPLGSRIVAEVVLGVLKADPDSYLNIAPEWQPFQFALGKSSEPRRIDSLRTFIAFAKDRTRV